MQLQKTDKAREALAAGKAGAVEMRDRRILILADGRRTRDELLAMLGAEARPAIERLVQAGFLAAAGGDDVRVNAERDVAPPHIVREAPPAVVAPARASRRSLAAAKMYLLDMLQLHRTGDAAALRLAMQTTSDPGALVDRMVESTAYLLSATKASYGERVLARLSEVLPEDDLPKLAVLRGSA
jgi:hypothetical protein